MPRQLSPTFILYSAITLFLASVWAMDACTPLPPFLSLSKKRTGYPSELISHLMGFFPIWEVGRIILLTAVATHSENY